MKKKTTFKVRANPYLNPGTAQGRIPAKKTRLAWRRKSFLCPSRGVLKTSPKAMFKTTKRKAHTESVAGRDWPRKKATTHSGDESFGLRQHFRRRLLISANCWNVICRTVELCQLVAFSFLDAVRPTFAAAGQTRHRSLPTSWLAVAHRI